jgi:DNA-binding SARP family transcriptional activator
MARRQRDERPHHYAVTQYNLAANLILQDRPQQALEALEPALEILESGSASIELAASRVLRAQALAMLGLGAEARTAIRQLLEVAEIHQEGEVGIGIADILDSYLDPRSAESALSEFDLGKSNTPSGQRLLALAAARMHARRRRVAEAHEALSRYPPGRPAHLGIESARLVTIAYVAAAGDDPQAMSLAAEAARHARLQGAHRWRRCADLLVALSGPVDGLTRAIQDLGANSLQTITYLADLVAWRLGELDQRALGVVVEASQQHPERWRFALRSVVDARTGSALGAASVLEAIGEPQDVRRLRLLAHDLKRSPGTTPLGHRLSRRVADRVFVEDQGRVRFRIGDREVAGSSVRRKVLALTCFLLSRPEMSSARDQVLEALWPDLAPEVAVNSLNQTLYFLRRVFEPQYDEDLSPGYVHHDSDILWFDRELVRSRSVECRRLLRALPKHPSPEQVEQLADLYEGRFSLDFEYEEWASSHRDLLHASYLEVIEHAVIADIESGHHDRGIRLARRALDIDSSAENIEVALLRLYRLSGAHSAAAEQYAHYASVLRDELGIEPPPLDSL